LEARFIPLPIISNWGIMKISLRNILIISSVLFSSSCVDEYWPELDKYQNLLVVDGTFSNEPGPYMVKLSLSSRVDKIQVIPISGATVIIIDDQDVSETLTETVPGTYMTSPDGIQGVIGRSYRIKIMTSDGEIYESEFEEINSPTEIESIYPLLETKEQEGLSHNLTGYQFYLNTHFAASDTNYFLTRLEATYEYDADFLIRFIYDGTLRPFTSSDSLQTCWRTYKVPEIFTYSTLNLSEPVILDYPLNFVDTETRELYIRYSLLVRQYTLSEKAYRFWTTVKEQNSSQGGLYNTQPYQVRGNLVNTVNPDEPVLGYFTVASISKRRIFVNPPSPPVPFYFPECEIGEWEYQNFGTIYMTIPNEWPVYATTDNNGIPALPNQECMDCQKSGGTIVKPDFWED
jgi:hypothetical protein